MEEPPYDMEEYHREAERIKRIVKERTTVVDIDSIYTLSPYMDRIQFIEIVEEILRYYIDSKHNDLRSKEEIELDIDFYDREGRMGIWVFKVGMPNWPEYTKYVSFFLSALSEMYGKSHFILEQDI